MTTESENVSVPLQAEILIRDTYRVHRIFSIVSKTQHYCAHFTKAYRELSAILANIEERMERTCKMLENAPWDLPEFVGRIRESGILKLWRLDSPGFLDLIVHGMVDSICIDPMHEITVLAASLSHEYGGVKENNYLGFELPATLSGINKFFEDAFKGTEFEGDDWKDSGLPKSVFAEKQLDLDIERLRKRLEKESAENRMLALGTKHEPLVVIYEERFARITVNGKACGFMASEKEIIAFRAIMDSLFISEEESVLFSTIAEAFESDYGIMASDKKKSIQTAVSTALDGIDEALALKLGLPKFFVRNPRSGIRLNPDYVIGSFESK